MNLFSYVVIADTGFAPNPYAGYCTLATCKPRIRRVAKAGDLVIGTGSARGVGSGRLVYAMLVSKSLPFETYSIDPRFDMKRPTTHGEPWQRAGDNIYFRDSSGSWQHRPSYHRDKHMVHDLSGRNVLVATTFHYFGSSAPLLPPQFEALIKKGPGHIRCTDIALIRGFLKWLHAHAPPGLQGTPLHQRCKSHVRPPLQ